MHIGGKKLNKHQFKFIYSKIIFIFAVLILIYMISAVIKVGIQKRNVNNEVLRLKTELQELEKEKSNLVQLLEYFKSDEFIKQEGKIKFGLRDKGENLVVISDKVNSRAEIKFIENQEKEELSNFQKWWNYFFN